MQLLLYKSYNIQRSFGCNNSNTTNCDQNSLRHTANLFFLSIIMTKKIDNTSKIDDNDFDFDHYNIM